MNQPDKIRLGLPMPDYLAHPDLAHHDLVALDRTPAHFKYKRDNPEEEKTRALIVGEIAHIAILEPKRYKDSHYVKPKTYEDEKGKVKPWNGNATVCKAWLSDHDDRPILTPLEAGSVIGMRKSVMEHRTAKEILKQGDAEVTLFGVDPDYGVPLKARPDFISGNVLVNVKTTEDASKSAFSKSVANFAYDSGAALHIDVANLAYGSNRFEFYVYLVIEKADPFAVAIYQLDEESIEIGRRKYKRWLALYKHCCEMDEWPGYPTDIQLVSLPEWSKRQSAFLGSEAA